jgi:hypothetical protein
VSCIEQANTTKEYFGVENIINTALLPIGVIPFPILKTFPSQEAFFSPGLFHSHLNCNSRPQVLLSQKSQYVPSARRYSGPRRYAPDGW